MLISTHPCDLLPLTFGVSALRRPKDAKFAICADPSYIKSAASIMPSLYRINSNSGVGGPTGYWSDDIFLGRLNDPDWTVIQPFVENGHKWIGSNCRLIIGIRLDRLSVTEYATACRLMAQHFKSTNGRNGLPLHVWGWEVGNENDSISINTYCQYFDAAADAFHSIDPTYRIIGPVSSWANAVRIKSFAQQCGSRIGAICYHNYGYCYDPRKPVPSDEALLGSELPAMDARRVRAELVGTAAAHVPIFMGEYNIECSATPDQRQQQVMGAVFTANWLISAHQTDSGVEMGAIWEMAGDGTYGVIQRGSDGWTRIVPNGCLIAKAGRIMAGQEVTSSFTRPGKRRCLAIANGQKIGVMIVNYDLADALSGAVGLGGWPFDRSTGGGTLAKWVLSDAYPDGVASLVTVTNELTEPIKVPPMSVVILHSL